MMGGETLEGGEVVSEIAGGATVEAISGGEVAGGEVAGGEVAGGEVDGLEGGKKKRKMSLFMSKYAAPALRSAAKRYRADMGGKSPKKSPKRKSAKKSAGRRKSAGRK
jgi:hypothetical protein